MLTELASNHIILDENLKLASQYRAWSDCMDMQAGRPGSILVAD